MRYKNLWKMPFFDEKRYKNSSENKGTLWLFCKILSLQPIGMNRVLKREFSSLIIQYIILDKSSFRAGDWGRWSDLIAMHHFSRTDGLFAGNKSFETVQLLCGQCFGDCHKQQPYVAAVAIFKIALVVIFWIEKEVSFLFLFNLLLYLQYG